MREFLLTVMWLVNCIFLTLIASDHAYKSASAACQKEAGDE